MRRLLELSLWQLPKWVPYVAGTIFVAIVAFLRYESSPFFGDKGSLLFFSLPIVIIAFIGGFGPGVYSAILSLIVAKYLFIPDVYSFNIADSVAKVSMLSSALNWLLICVICELLREAARSSHLATLERDSQRDHLSQILDSVSDGFFAVDNYWRITHANRAMREMVGQYATVDSQVIWDFFPPEQESIKQQLIDSKNLNQFVSFDFPDRSETRWFHFRAFPEAQGMFVYMQDITERKEAQARSERILADERHARSEAERASRLRDEFVATVSHELRTPLVAIMGWSELLQKRVDDPLVKEGLAAIETSSKLQSKLIEELLDISRMSSGKVPMNMEVVLLSVVIEEATLGCSLAANNKAIDLKVELPSQDVLIHGDAGRIHQIVTNLISNAVKFTKREGHVVVRLVKEGSTAILTVQDDGEGIPATFLPYVFDRFRQANATTTRSQGGLGLGLSIVKQLVELHGGSIEAASEGEGKGSTFTITFPIDPALAPEAPRPVMPIKQAERPLENIKVIVLEDDESTRDLLGFLLEESGADVSLAGDAATALPMIEDMMPDIVVSDIGMPGMDGYEFIGRVRQLSEAQGGNVPAVALTAFAREEDRQRALNAGFQAHLTKPIESSILIQTLRQLVRQEMPRMI